MVYLAGDVGGTNGRVVAYESLGATEPLDDGVRFKVTQHTPEQPGNFEKDFREVLGACRELQHRHGPIDGLGLAVAGKLDKTRSTLTTAGNLGHWVGQPIVMRLGTALKTPVSLGGDSEAAALAEAFYGVGQGKEWKDSSFIGMIWGTGVGGCGVHYRGNQFFTIPTELGHQCVVRNGRRCRCDQKGCLEAYVGGNGIRDHTGKAAEDLTRDELLKVAEWMALGIRGTLAVQPVDLIVFSGGIACKQQWILEVIEGMLTHPMQGSPKLLVSAFGESAGTLGALSLLNMPTYA